jgi:hypothetical protein
MSQKMYSLRISITALGLLANLKSTHKVSAVCLVEATSDNNLWMKVILVMIPKRKL